MKKTSLSLVAILLLAVPALAQVAPAKSADTSKRQGACRCKGHDALCVRQGCIWKIELQWALRHQLAAAHGKYGRQGIWRLVHRDA